MGNNSQDAVLTDHEKLLKEVRETAAELPGVARFQEALETALGRAVSSRRRREDLLIAARKATRQLNEDLAASREGAIALRNFIKSVLGFRSERLARYGIRNRGRAKKKQTTSCGLPS